MIRKLWIDSRQGIRATNDFTIELPLQDTTTQEQGCLVGQFSIPNVFSPVMHDYNDRLYFRVDGVDAANTIQVNVNDRFYWGYSSPGQQAWLNARGGHVHRRSACDGHGKRDNRRTRPWEHDRLAA